MGDVMELDGVPVTPDDLSALALVNYGHFTSMRTVQTEGFDDVLFVGPDGYVSEGATWNIAFFEDGRVTWPAAECLSGVTMRLLNAAMSRLGIEVRRAPVALGDLHTSCSAFITNAAVGLRPVRSIDGTGLAEATAFVEALRKEYDAIEGESLAA
jgi:branched-subunit amino acid aminotransferase/4-amino-4-deoxychorismate lyase